MQNKNLLSELHRMKQLAGLLKENEEVVNPSAQKEQAKQVVYKMANSEEFNRKMEDFWSKLSDEDKAKIAATLKSSDLSEGLNEGLSLDKILDKTMSDSSSLDEDAAYYKDREEKYKKSNLLGKIRIVLGNIIGGFGATNAIVMGMPWMWIMDKLVGYSTEIGSTGLSAANPMVGMAAGAVLWWLGNKIAGEGNEYEAQF